MYCPKCGYELICGCKACKTKIPKNHLPEIWDSTGEFISCPNCNLTKHANWWEELSIDIVQDKYNSLTEALKAIEEDELKNEIVQKIDKININNSFIEILKDPNSEEKANTRNFKKWLYGD